MDGFATRGTIDAMENEDITFWLNQYSKGDTSAREQLAELILIELRTIAKSHLRRFPSEREMDTLSLVHEAWIKLSKPMAGADWQSRKHFYCTAARTMRNILIDRLRSSERKRAQAIEELPEIAVQMPPWNLIIVNEILSRMQEFDGDAVELFDLKAIMRLTNREIADILQVTERTIERRWANVKSWIIREYGTQDDTGALAKNL